MTNPRLLPLLLGLGLCLWCLIILGLLNPVYGVVMLLILAGVAAAAAWEILK